MVPARRRLIAQPSRHCRPETPVTIEGFYRTVLPSPFPYSFNVPAEFHRRRETWEPIGGAAHSSAEYITE